MEADSSTKLATTVSKDGDVPPAESIGSVILEKFPYFSRSMVESINGWILRLKFGPPMLASVILLPTLLALRFVMHHDIPDYEEAYIMKKHRSLDVEILNYLLELGSEIRKAQPTTFLPLTAPVQIRSLARATPAKGQKPSVLASALPGPSAASKPEDDTRHAVFWWLNQCTNKFRNAVTCAAFQTSDFFVALFGRFFIQSLNVADGWKQYSEYYISLGSFHYALSLFPNSHPVHLQYAFEHYMTGTILLSELEGLQPTTRTHQNLVSLSCIIYHHFSRFPQTTTLSVTRKQQLCDLSELYSMLIAVNDDGTKSTETPIPLFHDTLLYLCFTRLSAITDIHLIRRWSDGMWTSLKKSIDHQWVLRIWLKSQLEPIVRAKLSTKPIQLSESILYILGELERIGDLNTYSYACLVLGWRFYMLFQHLGDENNLGDAFDYTVTGATLLYHLDYINSEETFLSLFLPLVMTIIMCHFERSQHHPPSDVEDERAHNFLCLLFTLRDRAKVVICQAMEYLGPSITSRIYRSLHAVAQSYGSDNWDIWVSDMFSWRYIEYHDSGDFEIAIGILEKAKTRQGSLSVLAADRLGKIYLVRYRRSESQEDFKISRECSQTAFKKMVQYESKNAVDPLFTLANLYIARIHIHGYNKTDQVSALALLGFAIDMVDESDSRYASTVIALGEAHALDTESGTGLLLSISWFQRFADLAIAEKVQITPETEVYISTLPLARGQIEELPRSHSTPDNLYLRGTAAFKMDDPECLNAFDLALSLMSEKDEVQMGIGITDKHTAAKSRRIQRVGEAAAAATLKFGRRPSRAIEYLETTLSIMYRQLLQIRTTSIPGLADEYPHLARKLEDISISLQRSSSYRSTVTNQDKDIPFGSDNFKMTLEYRDLLDEIRRKPGFENLFLPLSYSRLVAAARNGPVIVLSGDVITNSTRALIVFGQDTQEPCLVKLPGVPFHEVEIQCQTIQRLLGQHSSLFEKRSTQDNTGRAGRVGKQRKDEVSEGFDEILNWIWENIVQPVFENLQRIGIESGRIWWCPTGSLVHLPLHATAPLESPYISSYTPTLEALIKARTHLSSLNELGTIRLSAVGMMTYPERDYLALPKVETELEWLDGVARKNQSLDIRLIKDGDARVATVLDALNSSHLIHLACHGFQHATQPLDSHLMLDDGDLSLQRILNEDLKSAQFAFLSACQTATGDEKLVNESIHLSRGFMAAGFKGVIGTMWSMADDDAPMVTEEVYKAMITDGSVDITKAAEGLDRAMRKMREKDYPAYRWMPFVHFGV